MLLFAVTIDVTGGMTLASAKQFCSKHGSHLCTENEVEALWSQLVAKKHNYKFYGWVDVPGGDTILHAKHSSRTKPGFESSSTYKNNKYSAALVRPPVYTPSH